MNLHNLAFGGGTRRRMMMNCEKQISLPFPIENGTFTSLDDSTVTISNDNHIYAKSSDVGGVHYMWLSPQLTGWYTAINNFNGNNIYPINILFSLKIGDVVKFIVKNNNTDITNSWQSLYVCLVSGKDEKVASDYFQRKTEVTTEVIVTENIDVTALTVHINRTSTEAEFDLEVYVNDVRYF